MTYVIQQTDISGNPRPAFLTADPDKGGIWTNWLEEAITFASETAAANECDKWNDYMGAKRIWAGCRVTPLPTKTAMEVYQ